MTSCIVHLSCAVKCGERNCKIESFDKKQRVVFSLSAVAEERNCKQVSLSYVKDGEGITLL